MLVVDSPLCDSPSGFLSSPSATGLRLRGISGDAQTYELALGRTVLGSGGRCAIRIARPEIQPIHCVFDRSQDGVAAHRWADDIYLNGKPFVTAMLSVGDVISIGPLSIDVIGPFDESPQNSLPALPVVSTVPIVGLSAAIADAPRTQPPARSEIGEQPQLRQPPNDNLVAANPVSKISRSAAAQSNDRFCSNGQADRRRGRQLLASLRLERGAKQQLHEQVENLTFQLESATASRDSLAKELERDRMRLARLERQASEVALLTSQVGELTSDLEKRNETNRELGHGLAAWKAQFDAATASVQTLAEEKADLKKEVRKLAEKYQLAADKCAELQATREAERAAKIKAWEVFDQRISDLEQQLSEAMESAESTEEALGELKTAHHSACAARDEYRQRAEQNEQHADMHARLTVEFEESLRQLRARTISVQELTEANGRLSNELQVERERHVRTGQEKSRLADELRVEREQRGREQQENSRLAEVLRVEQEQHASKQQENSRLADELRVEKEERAREQQESSRLANEVRKTAEQLCRAEEENERLSEQIQRESGHYRNVQAANSQLSEQLRLETERHCSVQELNAHLQADRVLQDERIHTTEERLCELEKELRESRQSAEDLHATLADSASNHREACEERDEIKQRLEQSVEVNAKLVDDRTLLAAEKEVLVEERDLAQQRLDELQHELALAKDSAQTRTALVEQLNTTIAELKSDLAGCNEKLARAGEAHKNIGQELLALRQERDRLRDENSQTWDRVARLKEELAAAKSDQQSLADENADLRRECDEARLEQTQVQDTLAKLQGLTDSAGEERARLVAENSGLVDVADELRAEAARLGNDVETARSAQAELVNQYQECNDRLQTAHAELEQLRADSAQRRAEFDEQSTTITEYEAENRKLRAELEELLSATHRILECGGNDLVVAGGKHDAGPREVGPTATTLSDETAEDVPEGGVESGPRSVPSASLFVPPPRRNQLHPVEGEVAAASTPTSLTETFAPETPLATNPSAIDDDEESIEDYMARLMQRLRGDMTPLSIPTYTQATQYSESATSSDDASHGPLPPVEINPLPTANPEFGDELADLPVRPLAEFKPSGQAPERLADLQTFRELANASARSAIAAHTTKVHRRSAVTKVIVSTMAALTGSLLLRHTQDWRNVEFVSACALLAVAGYWFFQTAQTLVASNRASNYNGPDYDSDSEAEGGPLPIDIDRERW